MYSENNSSYAQLLQTAGVITPQDVLRFRREVFQDGIVSQTEADALFALNNQIDDICDEWSEYFIEVMSIFLVEQAEPRGYVSVQNANWLMNSISHDGVIKSATELELLVKSISKARSCPQTLVQFALLQVSLAVIEDEGPLSRGRKLTKGSIGEAEVELIRTILYASGGEGSISVSKQEAEVLVQLNDQTNGAENHPSWQQLFVRATANYLMAATGSTAPTREEALAREEWLDDTEVDTAGFISEMASGLGDMFTPGFFDDIIMSSHRTMEKVWKERNDHMESANHRAEAIDAIEAKWLIDRINADGEINGNEKALLEFLKSESHNIAPGVHEMINKVA